MAAITESGTPIAIDGSRKTRRSLTKARIRWVIAALIVIFGAVAGRLVQLGMVEQDNTIEGQTRDLITASRPAILDRNGLELAVDIRVPSLFAEPRRIIDVEEAAQAIHSVLPDINIDWLRQRLTGDKGFVWIKRELTPAIQERIMQLGIPGLDFVTESKRFYPGGTESSHILGAVNIDNQGIAGMEKDMDDEGVALLQSIGLARGNELEPVNLSIDLRVQHVMHNVLADALTRYKAIAAAGVMMDVHTGEILGLVSLPDFDPNNPVTALEKDRFNRITSGIYELGSTFKTVTMAAALDSGKVRVTDSFDARFGVRFGRFTIDDFHGKHRVLTVPEIYKYSSNIGTIKVMQALGKDEFRAFLTELGFDKPAPIELPERRQPKVPEKFSEIVAATASFGHGLSISPLHMVRAISAFVNGGDLPVPTLYRTTPEEAEKRYQPVVSEETSERIRYLMRLNALEGSGSRMNKFAAGYRAGGKTGTAEKVVNGRYDSSKSLAVFASAFPLDNPRYAMVILVDEPRNENEQSGRTAGWNAGEATGRIVQRVAPMLGISPEFGDILDQKLVPAELR
ncbi:MAG: penicillin-binding protein 2 [Devosia sp.]|uniref:peptidoglycan D,D-transpeptidase FtsI family protein n=1 Tax=Devosia sp. 66-22 TaxID=1895753 RepID=UPI00092A3A6B|nr:penicillin-binding protein 2 [Devosia sp. 66-22]MBN9345926.1 penicillin-binding protein 2 [Devosia sp.]OJX50643.1 MAG: cell division protein [Devosia sp. 66-22]